MNNISCEAPQDLKNNLVWLERQHYSCNAPIPLPIKKKKGNAPIPTYLRGPPPFSRKVLVSLLGGGVLRNKIEWWDWVYHCVLDPSSKPLVPNFLICPVITIQTTILRRKTSIFKLHFIIRCSLFSLSLIAIKGGSPRKEEIKKAIQNSCLSQVQLFYILFKEMSILLHTGFTNWIVVHKILTSKYTKLWFYTFH